MSNPPIPVSPCWICKKPTNSYQFIKGNACCYEHLIMSEKIKKLEAA